MSEVLPFDLGPGAAAFLALAVLVAAFIRGYSGFGFSAIVVAASGLVSNPLYFVPVVMMCEIAMTMGQAPHIYRQIDWRRVVPMLLAACAVMPFSIAILSHIGIDLARLVISLFVLAICVVMMAGWSVSRPIGQLGHGAIGAVSGLVNAAAVGGLPVALSLAAQNIAPANFRASLIFYLFAIDVIALPLLWLNGLISFDTLKAFMATVPLLLLGGYLGGRHFHASSPQSFRRFAISLLAVLAVMGLIKSVIG